MRGLAFEIISCSQFCGSPIIKKKKKIFMAITRVYARYRMIDLTRELDYSRGTVGPLLNIRPVVNMLKPISDSILSEKNVYHIYGTWKKKRKHVRRIPFSTDFQSVNFNVDSWLSSILNIGYRFYFDLAVDGRITKYGGVFICVCVCVFFFSVKRSL